MRALRAQVLLLLAGCGEAWSPETLVEDLRVLAMRADPAEIKPGESAALSALILDPSRPGKLSTVLWLGCDPDPFNLGRSACSDPAALQDPQALATLGTLPPGVHFIGFNDSATFAADQDLFRALAVDDPRRLSGTVGQVLAIAVAEEPVAIPTQQTFAALLARVQRKELKSVIALFRVRISEAPTRNLNPVIANLSVAGEQQFPGARTLLIPGEKTTIEVGAPESSFEPYVETSPTAREEKIERLTTSWYSTSGRFDFSRVVLKGPVKALFTAPGGADAPRDPVPARRTGLFYAVLRDSRGGQSWASYPYFICDPTLAPPTITAAHSPTTRADLFIFEGRNLGNVVDVLAGGVPFTQGAFNAATGRWEAFAPAALSAGTYTVRLHGQGCSRIETGVQIAVP